ncbi:uncharacterized protein ARMOST_22231 [Armillaria ostoyae]|uniref:Chromo domain-containing protein n=1 Tax=Armillaria ostoyae TaxID=47428 RepID=A0A284SCA1_ARMOS|nr:uncharacterized protein ARMOST_22231 [Armillaria ostoyae]
MSAYKLKLPLHWKIHPCFNEKLLTPYIPPVFPNQEQPPPPPPDLIDGEEQWELKEVLDSKMRKVRGKRGQLSMMVIDYFVKWKGWTREHNSWVAESDMGNAEEAIADYEKKVTARNRTVARLHLGKIIMPKNCLPLAMIINHEYKDSDFLHLTQRVDGTQKWIKNPNVSKFKDFLDEYWASQDTQYDSQTTEP